MAISSVTSKIVYVGDGVTLIFPYPFKIFAAGDLTVNEYINATGSANVLVLNSDYLVDGVGVDAGGNVTLSGSYTYLPTGSQLIIRRIMDQTQEVDYVENDPFPAQTHENALDKLTMIDQQLQEQLDRAMVQNITKTVPITFPLAEADKLLGWKNDLSGIENKIVGASSSALPALGSSNGGMTVKVNLATTGYVYIDEGVINIRQYGAIGNGVADDTAAILNAISVAKTKKSAVVVPNGTYIITAELDVYGVDFFGLSSSASGILNDWPVFKPTAGVNRTFKLGITGGTQDQTILANIKIDLANAPTNHVAIGSDDGVTRKIIQNIEIRGVAGTEVTDNFTGIKLTKLAGSSGFYNRIENVYIFNCFRAVDMESDGTEQTAVNTLRNIWFWSCYKGITIRGNHNLIERSGCQTVPSIAGGNEANYTPVADNAGHHIVRLQGNHNVIDGFYIEAITSYTPPFYYLGIGTQMRNCLSEGKNSGVSYVKQIGAAGTDKDVLDTDSSVNLLGYYGVHSSLVTAKQVKPNLVANPHFEIWNATSFSSPDGTETAIDWCGLKNGGTFVVSKNTVAAGRQFFNQSLKLNVSVAGTAGITGITQNLASFHPLTVIKSFDYVTAAVVVMSSAGTVRLQVDDGATITSASVLAVSDSWKILTVNHSMGVATKLNLNIGFDSEVGVAYIDSVMFYEGFYFPENIRPQFIGENLERVKANSIGGLSASATWNPGSIADGDEEATEVTVTGAQLGDFAIASFSLDVADLVLNAQVTAANTVTCVLANNTGGAVDLASGTVYVRVFRR